MRDLIWNYGFALLTLLLQLIGLTCAVLIDPYIRKKHKTVMLLIVAAVFLLLLQNLTEYQLDSVGTLPLARTAVSVFGYSVRPLILGLFLYIIGKGRSYWPAWVLISVNAAIHLTAFFSGVCFRITKTDRFVRGPLGYTCHVVSGILLLWLVVLTVRESASVRKREALIPVLNALAIIASVGVDSFVNTRNLPVQLLTVAVVSSCMFYYIWLHLQFVHEHEQALMAEQRIQIMMSQIQPHFLYNTLSTIQALCRIDPEQAFVTTEKFGTYLRQNLDSLSRTDLIPLQKELDHTRIYAEIEQLRFPSVRVEYTIEDGAFLVPALTVQPLVENAIRHGVRACEEGLVTVATRRLPDCHEITVRDNGVGFDIAAVQGTDGTHIGLRNVRERLERLCGGRLTIESVPGKGTTVTIRIPQSGR